MKKSQLFAIIVLATTILSSCGGGDSITEVKLIPVKSGKEFQYIDNEGKIVINPQFNRATIFRDGLALVQTSGDNPKWGFITEDGKYAINAQYKTATVCSEGLAWVVSENSAPSAINKNGELKFTLQDAEEVRSFKDGMAPYMIISEDGEEKWGFVNKEGKVVINPQFANVSNFSEGRCGVSDSEGKWGFIDKEGKIIINHQFEEAGNFKKGKCIVSSAGKKGAIDKAGKYIINPQFTSMKIDGNTYLVNQDGKWGWCDEDGKILINPQFGFAYPFNGNNITAVQSGKGYGYIDKAGKIVINPQFDNALPFNGKLALVVSANKIGFIDKEGKYVINPQFEEVSADLVNYYLDNSAAYSSIRSDYFNVGAITNILNFESPEGFTDNSTYEDVIKKYKIEESGFPNHGSEFQVLSNKMITRDAHYSFFVIGAPYDIITVKKQGWYGYYDATERKFNAAKKPVAFAYVISLNGKGHGKSQALLSALEGMLSGFNKDITKSNKNESVYSNAKKEVKIEQESDDRIIVFITNLAAEKGAPGNEI